MAQTLAACRAAAVLVAIASQASAERFTLAAPHPFDFAGVTGTILPVTPEEAEGTRVCVSIGCVDPNAGDQIFFRIALAGGSLPLHGLAVGANLNTNLVPTVGASGYVASGEEPIPNGSVTLGAAPAHLFPAPGTLDANETTPVLLNVYASGGIGALLDAGTLLDVRAMDTPASFSPALGSVAIARLDGPPAVSLELVSDGFDRPLYATSPPGDARVFVLEQTGSIVIVPPNSGDRPVFLTVDVALGDEDPFDERGLLGLAFAPDYATSGVFYVHYVTPDPADPDGPGRIVVARHTVSANPDLANASGTVLLSIPKPGPPEEDPFAFEAYHNGGQLAFGPDGALYAGVGDGGGWLGYDPWECAQNPASPFGKILRLDPAALASAPVVVDAAAQCPTLPAPSPAGVEIWASGLRNPWRFSFDRTQGDLWLGDVGQSDREEINLVANAALAGAGPNFGWDVVEGDLCNPNDPAPSPDCASPALAPPLHSYAHEFAGGCTGSVVGGYVHRGDVPALAGKYVFGDTCQGFVRTLEREQGGGVVVEDLPSNVADGLQALVSFGEGSAGQLYAVDWAAGAVYELVPEPSATAAAITAIASLAGAASRRRPTGRRPRA
jgi:glucose/arabinose dehydrogenase